MALSLTVKHTCPQSFARHYPARFRGVGIQRVKTMATAEQPFLSGDTFFLDGFALR